MPMSQKVPCGTCWALVKAWGYCALFQFRLWLGRGTAKIGRKKSQVSARQIVGWTEKMALFEVRYYRFIIGSSVNGKGKTSYFLVAVVPG